MRRSGERRRDETFANTGGRAFAARIVGCALQSDTGQVNALRVDRYPGAKDHLKSAARGTSRDAPKSLRFAFQRRPAPPLFD